jgi:hypothetical protein
MNITFSNPHPDFSGAGSFGLKLAQMLYFPLSSSHIIHLIFLPKLSFAESKLPIPCLSLLFKMSLNTCTAPPSPLLPQTFSISKLPPELRQQIYALYLTSIPPLPITTSNATHPLHNSTPLSLSPCFISDLPPSLFYQNTIFSFSSGEVMKLFSSQFSRQERIRKIKIMYGKEEISCPTRDWVVIMNECFEGLEEVVFCVEGGVGIGGLWWECVRDAVREGVCCEGRRKRLLLRVESGEWSACERIGAEERRQNNDRNEI